MDKISEIEKELKGKLSAKVFNQLAQETQFIQRIRETQGFSIFWSIISGFVIGQATEIAGMLRSFIKDTGIKINDSAWYKRLSKKGFSNFMCKAATHLVNHLYTQCLDAKGLLSWFDDIYVQDGSSLAINDLLQKIFPGRFTNTSPGAIENLLPLVNRTVSLLKRWLQGTHQGAPRPSHLDYYLSEFVFRFNRRTSRSRGLLFDRLIQQAVNIAPVRGKDICGTAAQEMKNP